MAYVIQGRRASVGTPWRTFVPLYGWVSPTSDEGEGFAFSSRADADARLADARASAPAAGVRDVAVVAVGDAWGAAVLAVVPL